MDAEAIRDLFQDLGAVRVRRMFGGHGVYCDDLVFALAFDGEIYLKTDGETRPAFEQAGSRAFVYEKDGKPVSVSYWLLPDSAADDPAEAARWARLALAASRRAGARKTIRRKAERVATSNSGATLDTLQPAAQKAKAGRRRQPLKPEESGP
jgi:DNA transformation protein and related proteins